MSRARRPLRSGGRLVAGYRAMLRLYPAAFREAFGAEMADVFAQAVDAAVADRSHPRRALLRLCRRELQDLPGAVTREWAACWRARKRWRQEEAMATRPTNTAPRPAPADDRRPQETVATPAAALMAALALLVPGLAMALSELPALQGAWAPLLFGAQALVLVGLTAGWLRGFPRWSYLYLGGALSFALYMSQVATPGLRLLGHTFGRNDLWGGRAWLGLAAVAVVSLAVTRSRRPLGRLTIGAWHDPLRLSLAAYGAMPLLLWLIFDEVRRPYPAPFLAAAACSLAGGAAACLRGQNSLRGYLALLAGLTGAWALSSVALCTYWGGPAWPLACAWAALALALLSPAVLALLRRARSRRGA